MPNKWDEMRDAFKAAELEVNAADAIVEQMAVMLIGRMRKVSHYRLRILKKELQSFNSQTGRWKN